MIAKRIENIEPSPTLALSAKVRELKAQGENVISFAAGEPDFDTPEIIKQSAIEAIQNGFTKYTDGAGIKELREAISEKLLKENNVEYAPDEIIVSCGAKHAVYNALMAICDTDDEVVLFAPYWATYRDQIALTGAKPVVVHTRFEDEYLPNIDEFKKVLTPKTKAILLNSPCNPTGSVLNKQILESIAEICLKNNIIIMSDEIYENHIYDSVKHISIASLDKQIAHQTIIINGVSKSFSMTGWRIGYSASNKQIAQAIAKLQDQVTSNASSISQKAAVSAIKSAQKDVRDMVKEFDARRCMMIEGLSDIQGIKFVKPHGAFYLFLNISELLNNEINTDVAFSQYMLDKYKVACVPGSAFSAPGNLRLTYSLSRDDISEGLKRLSEGINNLV